MFDLIEFLHDHASAGATGTHHTFSNCGWHYETFDPPKGRAIYRRRMNEILAEYGNGFELSESGEILEKLGDGLAPLLTADLPGADPANVQARVGAATLKYRRRGSTGPERRDAVRDLADVLEYLRADADSALSSKDEKDLFNIANNFGIRHHNAAQRTDYDQAIWLSWMFHYYLATIHAWVRLIDKKRKAGV